MDDASPAVHAVLLAAGAASRFGEPKQLVRLRGEPVLHELAAHAASVAGGSVTVVLGAHARTIAPALRQRAVSVVVNRGWEEGVASSIRAAVHAAPPGSSALLLMLADQVAITADDLQRLHASWRPHRACPRSSRAGRGPTCSRCGASATRARSCAATSTGSCACR